MSAIPEERRRTQGRAPALAGRLAAVVLAAAACGAWASASALADDREAAGKGREESLAARRFDLMRSRVGAATARSDDPDFPARFSDRPIFRYSDPARGYVAAAVWRLGDEGRPKALLTTELDRKDHGPPCIAYEYASLTATPFTLTSEDIRWSPSGTQYEFRPVPRAPAPADTPQRRLAQMRDLARRFAAREEVKGERCELRLLPAPVCRYAPSGDARADGAIFFFAFGTNPEVVLLLESDGRSWNYAAGRMTGAQVVELTLGGAVAWRGPPLEQGRNSSFTGSITPIKIPGVAADGTETRD
jgi:hypothetical protein